MCFAAKYYCQFGARWLEHRVGCSALPEYGQQQSPWMSASGWRCTWDEDTLRDPVGPLEGAGYTAHHTGVD